MDTTNGRKDLTNNKIFSYFFGSFWSSFFEDGAISNGLGDLWASVLIEAIRDTESVVGNQSHESVRVFKKVNRYLIKDSSDSFYSDKEKPRYGRGMVYGGGATQEVEINGEMNLVQIDFGFLYGEDSPKLHRYYIKNPGVEKSADAKYIIVDSVSFPTAYMVEGADFEINSDSIIFNKNPHDLGFEQRQSSNGATIEMWIIEAYVDYKDIINNFGFLFPSVDRSSPELKTSISCYLNVLSNGPTRRNIESFMSSSMGGVIANGNEVVIGIHSSESEGTLLETNLNLYKIPNNQSLSTRIIPGSIIKKYDSLTDIVRVINTKEQKKWHQLVGVVPVGGIIREIKKNAVLFPNEFSSVKITSSGDRDRIRFNVIGGVDTVDNFWRAIDKNISNDDILDLGLLDGDIINPADFFIDKIAQNSILPIIANINQIDKNNYNIFSCAVKMLHEIMPVHCHYFVFFTIDNEENINIENTISDSVVSGSFTNGVNNEDISSPFDSAVIRYRSICTT